MQLAVNYQHVIIIIIIIIFIAFLQCEHCALIMSIYRDVVGVKWNH